MTKQTASWLLLIAVAAALIWMRWPQVEVRTDVRSLLPDFQGDTLDVAAREQLSAQLERMVMLAVGDPDPDVAVNAALRLQQTLVQTQLFTDVVLDRRKQGEQLAASLFPYRFHRLSAPQQQMIDTGNWASLLKAAQLQLWSPSALLSTNRLIADPLFLFEPQLDGSLPRFSGALNARGMLTAQADGQSWILLQLQFEGNPFLPSVHQPLVEAVSSVEAQLQRDFADVQLLRAGMLFYADQASGQARKEMSSIGLGSMLAIVALIVIVFGSFRPLLLALAGIASGFMVAIAVVLVVYGQLHMVTFVFGASLIGVAIDYSFHFAAEHSGSGRTPAQSLLRIRPALLLGAATSVAAYLAMALMGVAGVRQMALFCASGLAGAAVSLQLLAPALGAQMLRPPRWPKWPLHRRWPRGLKWGVAALAALALLGLHAADDIRLLKGEAPALEQQQQQLNGLFGIGQANQFFLVRGANADQVLQREAALLQRLQQTDAKAWLDQAWGLSRVVPSAFTQAENLQRSTRLYAQLPQLVEAMGLEPELAEAALAAQHSAGRGQFTPAQWLATPGAAPFRYLWLTGDDEVATLVMLSGVSDVRALAALPLEEGISFVDPVNELSAAFAHIRTALASLLLLLVPLAYLLLSFFIGWSQSWRVTLVPTIAMLVALAVVTCSGTAINAFHLMALLLIFGIGMDYALFYAHADKQLWRLEMATVLAALSTLLGFGLLAFSQTPALAAFGVTVLVGIIACFLLAPQFNSAQLSRSGQ